MRENTLPSRHTDAELAEIDGERPRLLTLKATARVLGGISIREVYNRIYDEELEKVKIGRRTFVSVTSIDEYVSKLRAA